MKLSIIRQIFSPFLFLRVLLIKNTYWGKLYLKHRTSKQYYKTFHKKLDWKNPVDLNEKINWLKFNSDISLWTELADKYKVREYIRKEGFENLLVTLYGVWEDANDINFENLPRSFVMKTNNSCGTNILVEDKSEINEKEVRKQLNEWIKQSKRSLSLEPHYFKIKPIIIAEEYLKPERQFMKSSSLIDFKFWCLNGEPYIVMVLYNRNNKVIGSFSKDGNMKSVQACFYDLDWNLRPEIIDGSHKNDIPLIMPKPNSFEIMIDICKKLSKPFPQVRIDLYEVNNKIYFGEMTFTSLGGFMDYFSPDYLVSMGEKIDLTLTENGK